jgi:two-component system, NarL family, sensor kinase
VPEKHLQANLMLANVTGDTGRSFPPFLKGNRTEVTAWVDMLSTIGQKNSQLYEMVVRSPEPRQSGRNVVRELERERSRISRELHAGAGQPLAGIKLNLALLDACSENLPPQGREALARLQQLAEDALDQVRSFSHSLHPPEWQYLTVGDALRRLAESSRTPGRLDVDLEIGKLPVEPSHTAKIALYRCAQESIANLTRHSGATRFKLTLAGDESTVELCVEDNGHGIRKTAATSKGIGLTALREHAAALDGHCHIASDVNGTRITVRLPISED